MFDDVSQFSTLEDIEDAFRRDFDVMRVADVPRLTAGGLDVEDFDGDFLGRAGALVGFETSSPLQCLVVGVAVVLDREGDEVLDAAVFDFLEGFFDGLFAPVVLFAALAFDFDFRFPFIFRLLR